MTENDEEAARLREEQLSRQQFARNEQDIINQQQRQQQFVGVPPQDDDQPRRLNGAAPRDFADFEDSKETVVPKPATRPREDVQPISQAQGPAPAQPVKKLPHQMSDAELQYQMQQQ